MAGQEGSFAVEELDDELLIGRLKSEARRQVHIVVIIHAPSNLSTGLARKYRQGTYMHIYQQADGVIETVAYE